MFNIDKLVYPYPLEVVEILMLKQFKCCLSGVCVPAGHVVRSRCGGVGPGQLAAAGHRVSTGSHTQR